MFEPANANAGRGRSSGFTGLSTGKQVPELKSQSSSSTQSPFPRPSRAAAEPFTTATSSAATASYKRYESPRFRFAIGSLQSNDLLPPFRATDWTRQFGRRRDIRNQIAKSIDYDNFAANSTVRLNRFRQLDPHPVLDSHSQINRRDTDAQMTSDGPKDVAAMKSRD